MPLTLIVAAVIMLICVLCNKITLKIGIPMLFAFILLGMLFGSDGLFRIPFEDFQFAEQICTVALIFIMFYGGFGTNWNAARRVAPCALLLSGFTARWEALIVGCNLGGLGTLIASMASLISFKMVAQTQPQQRRAYLMRFTALNLLALGLLLALAFALGQG